MKVVIRSRTCRITFDKNDPYYAEKTLVLEGEGVDESSFCVHKHLDIFWSVPSPEDPSQRIGVTVKGIDRDKLLSYVIMTAKENGYSISLW